MSWAKIDDRANEHRKQLAAGAEACWLWTCALMYANRQDARDGFVPAAMLPLLYPMKRPTSLAERLVAVGLWSEAPGGYVIHQFAEWNRSKEKVQTDRESTRLRVAKHRAGNTSGNGVRNSVTPSDVTPVGNGDVPEEVAVAAGDPDLEQANQSGSPRAPEAGSTDQPEAPESPRTLPEALRLPITQRALFVEQNRHLSEWVQPEAWPEVQAVAVEMHKASRGRGAPKTGRYASDSGVRRVVELYAAGFSQGELLDVCNAVVATPWWSEGGTAKSLGALTVEVARRALSPGAPSQPAGFRPRGPVQNNHGQTGFESVTGAK